MFQFNKDELNYAKSKNNLGRSKLYAIADTCNKVGNASIFD